MPVSTSVVLPRKRPPRVATVTVQAQLARRKKAAERVIASSVTRGRATARKPTERREQLPRKRAREPSPSKASRARYRQRAASGRGLEITGDYLRGRAVRDGTAIKYDEFLKELEDFAAENGYQLKNLDKAISECMASQFAEGNQPFRGSYMIASVGWKWPAYGKFGSTPLPQARQTLAGWKTLAPTTSRLPLPPALCSGLAVHMAAKFGWKVGAQAKLMVIFYLRPGETTHLTGKSLIPPQRGSGLKKARWAIVLHPAEAGKPSKTQETDETLMLDLDRDQWFGPVLARLKADAGDHGPLFPDGASAQAKAPTM